MKVGEGGRGEAFRLPGLEIPSAYLALDVESDISIPCIGANWIVLFCLVTVTVVQ